MRDYKLYGVDIESCGLSLNHDVIEISLYRFSDDAQKTWFIKPMNYDNIETAALRINGHKIEDLKHQTKFGKDTYMEANSVIVDIENWLSDDMSSTEDRVLVGQNTNFDKSMMEALWTRCNAKDSFPFGRRYLDTMQIEFAMNLAQNEMLDSYSLSNIIKKYALKNDKAHTAAADCEVTVKLFKKQIEFLKSKMA